MADRFVCDPREVVRSGQVVRVKVVDVDVERQRIGLSLRLNDSPQREKGKPAGGGQRRTERRNPIPAKNSGRRGANKPGGSMAQALRDAGFGR